MIAHLISYQKTLIHWARNHIYYTNKDIASLTVQEYQALLLQQRRIDPPSWHEFRKESVEQTRDNRDHAQIAMHTVLCAGALTIAIVKEIATHMSAGQIVGPTGVTDPPIPFWLSILQWIILAASFFCASVSIYYIFRTNRERKKLSRRERHDFRGPNYKSLDNAPEVALQKVN
jgi:hypothetical protein